MPTFDQFCEDSFTNQEEREALVHHLAGIRYRETLKLIDGPIARAAKANAEKRRISRKAIAADTDRAGGNPRFIGPKIA